MSREIKIIQFCKKNGWVTRTASNLNICDDKQCPSCYSTREQFSKELEKEMKNGLPEKKYNDNLKNQRSCKKKLK